MKKFLILALALIMLVALVACNAGSETESDIGGTNTSSSGREEPPPRDIRLHSEEEVENLRMLIQTATNDEEFLYQHFNSVYSTGRGFEAREEAVKFLEILDALPLPYKPDALRTSFWISPNSWRSMTVTYGFSEEGTEWVRYTFFFDNESRLEQSLQSEVDIFDSFYEEVQSGRNSSDEILSTRDSSGQEMLILERDYDWDWPDQAWYWMYLNGFFVDVQMRSERLVSAREQRGGSAEEVLAEVLATSTIMTMPEIQERMAEQRAEFATQQEQAAE